MRDFHAAHHGDAPLLLPNAWDFASAATLAAMGFGAIGTTSLGVAAAAGLPDAAGLTRAATLGLARALAGLPAHITVDIEGGFSEVPEEVASFTAQLVDLGIAGVNIEDGRSDALAEPDHLAEVIAAVKRRCPDLFVNARTDAYWLGLDRPLARSLQRAERYLQAGATGSSCREPRPPTLRPLWTASTARSTCSSRPPTRISRPSPNSASRA